MVRQAQLNRIDLELVREFVHGRLEDECGDALTRTTHEGRRHRVAANQPMRAGEVLEVVDLRADAGCRFGPVIEVRGHRELLVPDRRQASDAGRAERQMVLLFLALTGR